MPNFIRNRQRLCAISKTVIMGNNKQFNRNCQDGREIEKVEGWTDSFMQLEIFSAFQSITKSSTFARLKVFTWNCGNVNFLEPNKKISQNQIKKLYVWNYMIELYFVNAKDYEKHHFTETVLCQGSLVSDSRCMILGQGQGVLARDVSNLLRPVCSITPF